MKVSTEQECRKKTEFLTRNLAHIPQPQIDEATLVAVQQAMAHQVAFSQIPDVVKGVRQSHHALIFLLTLVRILVHRPLSPGSPGQ